MYYALIGCGRIAANHIKAVMQNPELIMTAACDLSLDAIDALFKKTAFHASPARYTDYKTMLNEHPELDLVAIATSSDCHAEIALYFIDHGINVIIEKPMALSIKDADEIVRRSEKRGVLVSVCHQNRFNVAIQKLRKAMESGRFGKLSHGTIHVRWNRDQSYYDQAAWRGKWSSDGGCLFNQCIHGIDLLRWMMGNDIEEVYGVTCRQYHSYIECEDLGVALVRFKNGTVGTIEGTVNVFPRNLEETLFIFGENGTVKIGGASANNIDVWDFADEAPEDRELQHLKEMTENIYGNGHTLLYRDVIDALKNNRRPYVDSLAGRNAVELVLAVYKSSATGLPVKLPLTDCSSEDFLSRFD